MKSRHLLAAVVLSLLGGCTSYTYYRPTDRSAIQSGGNACARVVYFERPIRDGVYVAVRADAAPEGVSMWIIFGVPKGQTIRLSNPDIRLAVGGNAEPRAVAIEAFQSGSRPLRVPVETFEPTSLLRGTDRYAHLDPPYGPDERFRSNVLLSIGKVEEFVVTLPNVTINGVNIALEPIGFKWTTETGGICIQ
jgi:hypothetical protein